MNRIDELIAELYLDGVEFKALNTRTAQILPRQAEVCAQIDAIVADLEGEQA